MKTVFVSVFVIIYLLQKLSLFAVAGGDASTFGTQFYFGFLRQALDNGVIDILVHTRRDELVTFSITSLDGYSHFGTTSLDNPITLNIPTSFQVRDSNYEYRNLGLFIETADSKEISVTALGYTNNLSPRMTFLVHPYTALFTSEYIYYAMSASDTSDNHFSQILIVGIENNTNVLLRPTQNITLPEDPQNSSSPFIGISSGSIHNFVIHKMQTVLITSNNNDLTGSKITTNKPISVISGHDCAKVPYTLQNSDCDPLATQIPPTANWDKLFLLPPLNGRTNGQKYKIITSENDTNVTMKCGSDEVTETVLSKDGDVYDIDIMSSDFCLVLTDKPCYVGEFAFVRDYYGDTTGDPLLISIPPVSQYIHNVTFSAFQAVSKNFFSVIIPNDEQHSFTFIYNGNAFTPTWTSIYYPNGSIAGYGYSATFSGTVTLNHMNPNGLLCVTVYGFTTVGGYGYLAGRYLKLVNPDFDAAEVTFVVPSYIVNEDIGEITIALNRSVTLGLPIQVRVVTHSGTGQGGSDYDSIEQIIFFSSEETIKNFTVAIIDDDLVESCTEMFTISMVAVTDYTIVTGNVMTIITIQDNDVLQVGFSSSPVISIIENIATFDVSIISGRLQNGLAVSIELKIGSNTTDDGMLDLLCILDFNEAINNHKLVTTLNSHQSFHQLQWTLSNLSLTSSHACIGSADVGVLINPYEAPLLTIIAASSSRFITTPTVEILCKTSVNEIAPTIMLYSQTSALSPVTPKASVTSSSALVTPGVSISNSPILNASSKIYFCAFFQNILIAATALFLALFAISCIVNIAIFRKYYVRCKKVNKDNNITEIDHDLTLYSNSLYGESSASIQKVDLNQRSLPQLPPDYDNIKIYDELKHVDGQQSLKYPAE